MRNCYKSIGLVVIGFVAKAGVKNLDCQVEWEENIRMKSLTSVTNEFFQVFVLE